MKRREEKLSSKQMGEHEVWCECGFENESSRRHRYVLFIPPVKRWLWVSKIEVQKALATIHRLAAAVVMTRI